MVTCPKCGQENSDTARNCTKCRVNLAFALEHPDELVYKESPEEIAAEQRIEARAAWIVTNLDKWEYWVVQQSFKHIDIEAINALGRIGWELVSVIPSTK